MHARAYLLSVALLITIMAVAGCSGEDGGPTEGPQGPSGAGTVARGDAGEQKVPGGQAKTAPGARGASGGATAAPAPPQRLDMLALERQPGATPAIAQLEVMPGPRHSTLKGIPGPSPAMGPDTALVKVFVFSDFQCPVCRRIVEPLKHIVRTYPEDVQVLFKHHALFSHRHARGAAMASMAAFRQGKFWEYHDKLFQNQRALQRDDLIRYAQELGLDVELFQVDMAAPEVAAQVDYEGEMADKLGARGTPGLFINGMRLDGWGSYPGFKGMVDRALQEAKKLADEGVARDRVVQVATAAAGEDGKLFAELMWGVGQ